MGRLRWVVIPAYLVQVPGMSVTVSLVQYTNAMRAYSSAQGWQVNGMTYTPYAHLWVSIDPYKQSFGRHQVFNICQTSLI